MERSILMSDKKKDRPWDGRSRIPTQQYKDNHNEIFKKETFGVSNYHERSRKKIGRHKKNMNKSEKRSFKYYVGQGR